MKYFATAKHHSQVSRWEELEAETLTAAKRKATQRFKGELNGSVIHLVLVYRNEDQERLNDFPAYTKKIATYPTRWEEPLY